MTPAEIAEISRYALEFNQRLGQYLVNCMHERQPGFNNDLFYVPDETLIEACRNYYAIYKGDV